MVRNIRISKVCGLGLSVARSTVIVAILVTATVAVSPVFSSMAEAAVVSSISVRGNQRVDADTIRSYVTVKPGQNYTSFDTDESLRQLFATGLFSDVRIVWRGNTLVVEVERKPDH